MTSDAEDFLACREVEGGVAARTAIYLCIRFG